MDLEDPAVPWDANCDVLVVGSGGGALTGAYTAAREGLRVIVVEATDRVGGMTAYSGGGMWFPCNPVLRRAGDDDTIEDALAYFRTVVGDRTPADLQEAFVTGGAALVEYLEEDPAFEFQVLPWPDYFGAVAHARPNGRHIVPVPLPADRLGAQRGLLRAPLATDRGSEDPPQQLGGGQALIGRFLLALDKLPTAQLWVNARCEELIRLGGRVSGAVISTPDGSRRIHARRGILISAGGFERNELLRKAFGVPGFSRDSMAPPGNCGAALQAAIQVGADVDLMSEAWWAPGLTHPDGSSTFSLWFSRGIFVNGAGQRFTNESAAYDRAARDVLTEMRAGRISLPYWLIYDSRGGRVPPVLFTGVPLADADDYVHAGLWHAADTLAELADHIGVSADQLTETVKRFNGFAASGVDEDFGRGAEPFDKSAPGSPNPLVPIDRPPFRAAALGLSDLGTKGGLRNDAHARVIDVDGHVIPGLYAAGNSMAAVSGTTYPGGGNPVGASMVFSHRAALDMVESRGARAR
ncbi:MAG TPA: FAD-binding protein [Mycobacterium sp.]|uniref:FAD-binding protein n=1 Tax=Mycobacterium sp. TaxID=1785 RepID=UPI002D048FF5|nr:FAD-binding protein [Mycobacterium sp.]HME77881.1 FAD-binding protein [Mycobacterium sp.]